MIALLAEVEKIRKLYLLSVLTAVLNVGFCASKIFLELHFVFIWYFPDTIMCSLVAIN